MKRREKRKKFEKFFREYELPMYRVSFYYTQEPDVAAEILQKAFVNLYIHFENVEPKKLRAYMVRCIRNMAFNWARDHKRLKDGYIEDMNEEDLKDYSVEDIYIREEEKNQAGKLSRSILSGLYAKNKKWYEAVLQAYYLNIPVQSIAKDMGVRREVICSRLYRAKKWIKEEYREQYIEYKKHLNGE